MTRPIFDESRVHASIRNLVGTPNDALAEAQSAIAANDIVVIGMKQNPHPKQARAALNKKGVAYKYLEYGSYFAEWRKRLTLKMWTGWPTFPMVFVKGTFIGGASDLEKLIGSGELDRMLQVK